MYTNNNTQQSQEADWSYPRRVIKKAMSKARPNANGSGVNRGILIVDPETNQEKWINVDGNANQVIGLKFGSWCWYAGHSNRPSLTVKQSPQEFTNISMNQAQADHYNRQAQSPMNYQQSTYESIDQQLHNTRPEGFQPEINNNYQSWDNNSQNGNPSSSNNTIDEVILEKHCVALSNAVNLMSTLTPQLSEESIVKLAISATIAANKEQPLF